MSEIPRNWATAKFLDVFDIHGGTQPPKSTFVYEPQPGYVQLLQIRDFGGRPVPTFIRDEPNLRKCTADDILIARYGASLGRILTGLSGAYNVAMARVDIPPELNKRYVFHLLNSEIFQAPLRLLSRSAQNGFNKDDLSEFHLPVAPLSEQKRITDKLDAIRARVDACRERLERVPAILKRFRQAVLSAASSGELTKDQRDAQSRWRTVTVQSIATEIFDGPFGSHLKSQDYSDEGIRVVRLENIGWLKFVTEKETFIPINKFETLRKHTLDGQDVLFSSFISEEVRVSLLPEELSGKAINKADCFCIRCNKGICLPKFLAIRLASPSTFKSFEDEVHGATRPRINLGQLKRFTFDLPSIEEQTEIVLRVDRLFEYADRLIEQYGTASAQVGLLTPALLSKAFRGELVPQDPNDEPASVLLNRIRAQKLQPVKPVKARKGGITKREVQATMTRLVDLLSKATDWVPAEEAFRLCGISNGSSTDQVEQLYAELRALDKAGHLQVSPVFDDQGRKLYDRLKLKSQS